MRVLIEDMRLQWSELDRRIAELDKEFAEWTCKEEAARRLMTIPGIGVLNATALIAAIGRCSVATAVVRMDRFILGARPDRGCDGHLLQGSRLRRPLRG